MSLSDYADPLFVAITRPAMKWGVPYDGLWINFITSYVVYFVIGHADVLSVRGLGSLFCFPMVHVAMRVGVAKDPNMFRLVRVWIDAGAIQIRRAAVMWPMPWWRPRSVYDTPAGGL